MKKIAYFIIGIAAGAMFSLGGKTRAARPIQIQAAPDTLTDWQMLQLAIIMTESKGDPEAVGCSNDVGVLQITPIYVREANRLAGTDYTHEDAFDIGKSLEMFSIIQGHYNPEHSADKAIRLHNPGGNAVNYAHKVQSNMMLIQRLEAARKAIIQQEL